MAEDQEIRDKNAKIPHKLDWGEYGFLKFQEGPRNEVGINGLFIEEDVLPMLVQHLKNLSTVLPSRETSIAITKLEECKLWLMQRRLSREEQGVLGTYKSHK